MRLGNAGRETVARRARDGREAGARRARGGRQTGARRAQDGLEQHLDPWERDKIANQSKINSEYTL